MSGTSHQVSLWPLAHPWDSVSSLRAKVRATAGAYHCPGTHCKLWVLSGWPIPTRTTWGLKRAQSAQLSLLPIGPCRVRSIIMLQEKAQDRERLLLKFIKIMKVTVASSPEPAPSGPAPRRWEAPGLPPCPRDRLASLCSIYGSSTTSTPTWPSSRHWTPRPSAGWSGRSRPQR